MTAADTGHTSGSALRSAEDGALRRAQAIASGHAPATALRSTQDGGLDELDGGILRHLDTGPTKGIPAAAIARLPVYLRVLNQLAEAGIDTVRSGALAEAAGVNSAQLRKDLSYLGSYGRRGVGYDVGYLRLQIGRQVGSTHDWPVIIVGLGNLGTALANYSGFYSRGFRVVGLIDPAPDLVGKRIHGLAIRDLAELEDVVASTAAAIAVIATPAEAAQPVADRLVDVGVTSILNFAPTVLVVPEGVNVRKVDLGQELQILAYHEQRARADDPGVPR